MNKTHSFFNEIVCLLPFMCTSLFYNVCVSSAKEKVPVLEKCYFARHTSVSVLVQLYNIEYLQY